MNRRYDCYLVQKYEPLYCDRYAPMTHTAMCWGFSVGDGWFNIINRLSALLCSEWLNAKADYDYMKDREGCLMFDGKPSEFNTIITAERIQSAKTAMDEAVEKVPVVTQVKEKYGTLRFYTSASTNEQRAYINFAESMSAVTCEVCGNKGKRSGYGWVATRCREHENN